MFFSIGLGYVFSIGLGYVLSIGLGYVLSIGLGLRFSLFFREFRVKNPFEIEL